MTRNLSYSAEAELDLGRAIAWQTQHGSGAAARRRLVAIIASVNVLKRHPCLWRREEGVGRVLIVAGHRVIYSVAPDTGSDETAGDVVILRILGPGQIF